MQVCRFRAFFGASGAAKKRKNFHAQEQEKNWVNKTVKLSNCMAVPQ
jgi:hypothetical protein